MKHIGIICEGPTDYIILKGVIDRMMQFDDYINDESIKELRVKAYEDVKGVVLL